MNITYWMLMICAAFVACSCDEDANTKTAEDRASVVKLIIKNDNVKKRQTTQEKNIGLTQHIQYGASPGHYVLKQAKEDETQLNIEYLNLLKKLQDSLQSSAAEPKPAVQQYVIQRNPNPRPYRVRPAQKDQKIVKIEPSYETEQVYYDDKYLVQQQPQPYQQPRVALRPAQAVKTSPVQALFASQGYFPVSNGHTLHESRVQAALSVGDLRPTDHIGRPQIYKPQSNSQTAFPDSSFEKELAELVAANQAIELKDKSQQFSYYQSVPSTATQYSNPSVLKKPAQFKANPQVSTSVVPLARSKNPGPQQYLIETTRPQTVQNKPIPQKTKPQYVQLYPEDEPRYVEYQQPIEHKSALKIVSAPRLQTAQPPPQYEYATEKPNTPPPYLKYYQTIKPQPEEVEAPKEVKIGSFYPKYTVPKQQLGLSQSANDDQQQYIVQYQPQAKPEEPPKNYVRYEAPKQQVPEYSTENEAYLRALIAQSQQKQSPVQSKPVESEKRIKIQTKPKEEAHSSIYVSKTIAPKKQEQSVKIVNTPEPEVTEEIQTVIRLPPPKNNKVYTQEEFQALLEAGYSVTPIPVTDDEGTPAKFSPPPPNYPGHKNYQVQYQPQTPERQYYQSDNTESYTRAAQPQVPRKRKNRRPTNAPQYAQEETVQAVSETQNQYKYSLPLVREETVSYGLRTQPKGRDV